MVFKNRINLWLGRGGALLIDFVFIFLIRWGLRAIGIGTIGLQPVFVRVLPFFPPAYISKQGSFNFYGILEITSGLPEAIMAAIWCVYAVVSLSFFGQTLGMHHFRLELVDKQDKKPYILRVIVRHLISPIFAIYGIGYVIALFIPGVRAPHDLLTGTRVIKVTKTHNQKE